MPWVRIDDHFDEHPKIAKVGPLGVSLWLAGLSYCNRNETDGFIPWAKARNLLSWEFLGGETNDRGEHRVYQISVTCGMNGEDVTTAFVIDLLVDAGLWTEVDGGYCIHDYSDYQPTKEQLEAERAKKQAAGHLGGQARAKALAEARAIADATAGAKADAQAKSKPVPGPGPVPGVNSQEAEAEAPRARAQPPAAAAKCADEFYDAIGIPTKTLTQTFHNREVAIGRDIVKAGAPPGEPPRFVDWYRIHFGGPPRDMRDYETNRAIFLAGISPRGSRNGNGKPERERRTIDHSGCPAGCTKEHRS